MAAYSLTGGKFLQDLLKKYKTQSAHGQVGYFPESVYTEKDGEVKSCAQVMADNEFGHINPNGAIVPARSVFGRTQEEQKEAWKRLLENTIKEQGENVDVKKAYRKLVFVVKKDLQETFDWWAEFGEPRNATSTIEEKGFDSPLTKSGQLREKIRTTVK